MKKLLSILILATLYCTLVTAQNITSFGSDKAITLPKLNVYERFIGADTDGFYALRLNEKDEIFLDFFNSSSMTRESSNELVLPTIDGFQSTYVNMFYLDRELILFTQVENTKNKEKTLYIQKVTKSGDIMGSSTAIGKLTPPNNISSFNVELTENQQNIFVYYNKQFDTYDDEAFFFKVFDSNLKEILNTPLGKVNNDHTNFLKIPLEGRSFNMEQVKILKNGSIYMIVKVDAPQRRAGAKGRPAPNSQNKAPEYKFIAFDSKSNSISVEDVKSKKFVVDNLKMGVDFDDNINIYGFLKKKGKSVIDGVFHKKYNTSTKEFAAANAKKADYIFTKNEIYDFRADRVSKFYDEVYNYEILNILNLTNGGSVMISEHSNHWVDSIIVPGSKQVIYNDYYRFNDILVAYCNPENEMEWSVRIPKSQYSYNDIGKFSSCASFSIGEKVFICYNDNSKNIKPLQNSNFDGAEYKDLNSPERNGSAVMVTLFSDGKGQGQALFNKNNSSFRIVPEFVKEFNNRYYFYTQNKSKVKFAVFTGR